MATAYMGRKLKASPNLHPGAWSAYAGRRIMLPMAKRHYLKQWRNHLGLSQEQVVGRLLDLEDDKLPATAASLSRLENGHQPYSERVIEALAFIYGREPWELIGNDPTKEGMVVDLTHKLNDAQQRQVLALIEAMQKEA